MTSTCQVIWIRYAHLLRFKARENFPHMHLKKLPINLSVDSKINPIAARHLSDIITPIMHVPWAWSAINYYTLTLTIGKGPAPVVFVIGFLVHRHLWTFPRRTRARIDKAKLMPCLFVYNFQHLTTSHNPLMVMDVPFPTISAQSIPITTDWVIWPITAD